jgi:putative acetyltransferase
VRTGAAGHYSDAQRRAWAPHPPRQYPDTATRWLAHVRDIPAGYITLTPTGYIDHLFVLPEFTRRGVAQSLYDTALHQAKSANLPDLTSHASHFAMPFFRKNGWHIIHPETVTRHGQQIPRFFMRLRLD